MSATKSIKISYLLNPPASISSDASKIAEELPQKSKSHEYQIVLDQASGADGYYSALRKAVEAARSEIGDELTKWRDIVGKEELGKEGKKGKTVEEADEEEEEEDES